MAENQGFLKKKLKPKVQLVYLSLIQVDARLLLSVFIFWHSFQCHFCTRLILCCSLVWIALERY